MSLYTSSHIYTDKTMEGIDNDVTFRVEKRSTCRWSMTFHMRASVFSRWPEAICSAVMGAPCSSCMRTPDLLKLSIATSQLCARFLGMWQGNLIFCGHQRDLSIKLITIKSALESHTDQDGPKALKHDEGDTSILYEDMLLITVCGSIEIWASYI